MLFLIVTKNLLPLKLFDNFCWHTSDHAIIWYILHNDSTSCHGNIIPYMYRPYYRNIGTKRHIITYCWSPLVCVTKCCAVNTPKVISYRISRPKLKNSFNIHLFFL